MLSPSTQVSAHLCNPTPQPLHLYSKTRHGARRDSRNACTSLFYAGLNNKDPSQLLKLSSELYT